MQTDLFNYQDEANEKVFYNTIHAQEPELSQFKKEAKGQEKAILSVFEDGNKYTALAIKRKLNMNQDSCKRAINSLFKAGLIVKLGKEDMVMEEYGKLNHRWQIKNVNK